MVRFRRDSWGVPKNFLIAFKGIPSVHVAPSNDQKTVFLQSQSLKTALRAYAVDYLTLGLAAIV